MEKASSLQSTAKLQPRKILHLCERLIGFVVLVFVSWYFWNRRQIFIDALFIQWDYLLVLSLLVIVGFLINATQSMLIYRALGASVGFWENTLLVVGVGLANYLPMRYGTLLRARYVKEVHQFNYTRSGLMFGFRVLLLMAATGFLGLIGTVLLYLVKGVLSSLLLAAFSLLALGACAIFLVPLRPMGAQRTGFISKAWNDLVAGVTELKARPSFSIKVLLLVIAHQLTLGARFYVSLQLVEADISPLAIILMAPPVALSSFLALTPGNLGIREAVMGYIATITGASFDAGLFVGAFDRVVSMGLVGIFGLPSFIYLWQRLNRYTQQNLDQAKNP